MKAFALASTGTLVMMLFSGASYGGQREDWLRLMRANVPTALCKDDSYFRRCFDVTGETCESITSRIVQKCLSDVSKDLPAQIDQASGRRWGEVVGGCAGNDLEQAIQDRRLPLPACKPASPPAK